MIGREAADELSPGCVASRSTRPQTEQMFHPGMVMGNQLGLCYACCSTDNKNKNDGCPVLVKFNLAENLKGPVIKEA